MNKKDEQVELIEDNPKYYRVRSKETGNEMKFYKIDKQEIISTQKKSYQKMAHKLSESDIILLVGTLFKLIYEYIDVSIYEEKATELAQMITKLYTKIGSPNQFYYDIKEINPGIHGSAQTFRKQIKSALVTAIGVAVEMEAMGNLKKEILNKWKEDCTKIGGVHES